MEIPVTGVPLFISLFITFILVKLLIDVKAV